MKKLKRVERIIKEMFGDEQIYLSNDCVVGFPYGCVYLEDTGHVYVMFEHNAPTRLVAEVAQALSEFKNKRFCSTEVYLKDDEVFENESAVIEFAKDQLLELLTLSQVRALFDDYELLTELNL